MSLLRFRPAAVFLSIALLAVCTLRAQGTRGVLVGTITDPSGAAVADAQVTVTNQQTNLASTTTATAEGQYTVPTSNISVPSQVGRITSTANTPRDIQFGLRLAF